MPDIKRDNPGDVSISSAVLAVERTFDTIAEYQNRRGDKAQVEEECINAYGVGIGEIQVGEDTVETYVDSGFSQAIHSGEIDIISIGWDKKVPLVIDAAGL